MSWRTPQMETDADRRAEKNMNGAVRCKAHGHLIEHCPCRQCEIDGTTDQGWFLDWNQCVVCGMEGEKKWCEEHTPPTLLVSEIRG
jgi:hypothetical protein